MDRVITELSEDKDADVRAFFEIPQAYDSDGEPIGDISVSFTRKIWPSRNLNVSFLYLQSLPV